MKYEVYFEFFGRKMHTEVDAPSEQAAKNIITNRIIFFKVVAKKSDKSVEFLKDFFGMK